MRRFVTRVPSRISAPRVCWRAVFGVGRVASLVLPLAACASLPGDLYSLIGEASPPPALALAPSADPYAADAGTMVPGGFDDQTALVNAPPPASADLAVGPAIQGQPMIDYAPAADLRPAYPAYVDEGDPLEEMNRAVFHFNDTVDSYVLEPVARAYRYAAPPHVRESVRNALANLESPVTLANDMLQGEWDRAHVTVSRFLINSTIGVAGLHDRAAEMGYPRHREDFDQTLALHGIPSGPYLVVPLMGPATPRHIVGRVVDSFAHPLTWVLAAEPIETVIVERAAEGVVQREEVLDALEQTKALSTDYYVAVRSFYRQNRVSEITNGQTVFDGSAGDAAVDPYEGIDIDF